MDDPRIAIETVLVSLWPESWNDLVRGGLARPPGRLIQSLASADVASLVVANPPRSLATTSVKRVIGRREPPVPHPPHGSSVLLEPLALHRAQPRSLRSLRRSQSYFEGNIRRELGRTGIDRPPVVTFNPLTAGFCALDWTGPALYYARDDWAAHPSHRTWWPAHEEAYRLIRRRELPVVAVSMSIIERLQPEGPAMVLPNGIDETEWTVLPDPPAWVESLPRPLFVYVGSLDGRLDVDALEAVRRRFPTGSIVLAGPLRPGNELEDLAKQERVHVVSLRDRTSVVGLVGAADACMLPHRRTPLTESMNPLKLYEYLAAGRPTAATDLKGSRGIDPSIILCHEGEDFADAMAAALDVGPMDETSRLTFIDENRWLRRHAQLLTMLDGDVRHT